MPNSSPSPDMNKQPGPSISGELNQSESAGLAETQYQFSAVLPRQYYPPGSNKPNVFTPSNILALQRTIGNRAVQRMLTNAPSRPKKSQTTTLNSSLTNNVYKEPRLNLNFTQQSKQVVSRSTVQRTLQGTADALEEAGGKEVSTLKSVKLAVSGNTWGKIVKKLREYEGTEVKHAAMINEATPGKYKAIRISFMDMTDTLKDILKLVDSWLKDNEHLQKIPAMVGAVNSDPSQDRGPDSRPDLAKDDLATLRRFLALKNIRTRISSELETIFRFVREADAMPEDRAIQKAKEFMKFYSDTQSTAAKDNALGGQASKLDIVSYRGKQPIDVDKKIFKPEANEDQKRYAQAVDSGIPRFNPNWGGRNVAASRLDQLLNSNIIVKTEFAVHNRMQLAPDGVNDQGKEKYKEVGLTKAMGVVMDFAPGVEARSDVLGKAEEGKAPKPSMVALSDRDKQKMGEAGAGKVSLDDPVLQRCLNKLQILDALCGQVDRHNANFFIDFDKQTGAVKSVTGIDNDMAFGRKHTDPSKAESAPSYRGLPPLVDKELGETILQITPDQIQAVLKGLLEDAEIMATLQRLKSLQAYIRQLKEEENRTGQKKLLEPGEWNAQTAKAQNEKNSYLGGMRNEAMQDSVTQYETIVGNTGVPNKFKEIISSTLYDIMVSESFTPAEGIQIVTTTANNFANFYKPNKANLETEFSTLMERIAPIQQTNHADYETQRKAGLAKLDNFEKGAIEQAKILVIDEAARHKQHLRALVEERKQRHEGKRGGVYGVNQLVNK